MINTQTAPQEFNNADWKLHKGNKNHVRFLKKCLELFWLIWEYQQLTGEAFFQQDWLAAKLGISVRHVQNLIAELRSNNLIEVDRRNQNYYKITEFFSKSPNEWIELAKTKAKAAIAKFFPNIASQKANTEKQASKPRKENSFKAAKTQTTTQPTPSQSSPAQQAASEETMAEYKAMQSAYEAICKAEIEPVTAEIQADIEEVAKQVAKENKNKPRLEATAYASRMKEKLAFYGLEVPSWLIGKIALQWQQKQSYTFS